VTSLYRRLFAVLLLSLLACSRPDANLHAVIAQRSDFYISQLDRNESLRALFTRLGEGVEPHAKLLVNEPYRSDAINVYVLDLTDPRLSDRAHFPGAFRQLLEGLDHNAIAVPPDIILFDIGLVGELVSNAFAGITVELQMSRIDDPLPPKIFSGTELLSIVADYHRLRNIRLSRGMTTPEDDAWIADGFDNNRRYWDRILDIVHLAGLEPVLSGAIAPVFYHELAHLRQNTSAALFPNAEGLIDGVNTRLSELAGRVWQQRIKRIEDEADQSAVDELRAFVESSSSSGVMAARTSPNEFVARSGMELTETPHGLDGIGNYSALYLLLRERSLTVRDWDKLSIAATAKFYRDLIIAKVFQGFRGLAVENAIMRFTHKDCTVDPQRKPLEFNYADDLVKVERGVLPILSADDWKTLRQRFFADVNRHTHSHNFYRAAEILRMVAPEAASDPKTLGQWEEGSELFDSMFQDRPDLLEPQVEGNTGVPVKRLLAWLDRVLDVSPAITCKAKYDCFVGRLKAIEGMGLRDTGAFLEVVADRRGMVVYARMAFPISKTELGGDDTPLHREEVARYLQNLAMSARFIANVFNQDTRWSPDQQASEDDIQSLINGGPSMPISKELEGTPVAEFGAFRQRVLECRAATETIAVGDAGVLQYRTLAPTGWISIELRTKS